MLAGYFCRCFSYEVSTLISLSIWSTAVGKKVGRLVGTGKEVRQARLKEKGDNGGGGGGSSLASVNTVEVRRIPWHETKAMFAVYCQRKN